MPRKYARRFKPRKGMKTVYRSARVKASNLGSKAMSQSRANRKWQAMSFAGPRGWMTSRSPFPPNMWTTMSYSETFTLSQSVGAVPAVRQYRANGPYDPRVAAGGIQPRYFDSLLGPDGGTAPYRNYRVHASKIQLSVFPTVSTPASSNAIVSIIPARAATSTPSTVDEQRERPYSKSLATAGAGSWKPYKLSHFTKMKYHLGHKDLVDVDASAALYNANPSEEVYWNIVGTALDGGQTIAFSCQITITYYVQLYTLVDVADS